MKLCLPSQTKSLEFTIIHHWPVLNCDFDASVEQLNWMPSYLMADPVIKLNAIAHFFFGGGVSPTNV